MVHPLALFSAPIQTWFRERYGEPTPPQALGWPAIARGENTLILSPTGSGKTMAAFLWGIQRIFADLQIDPNLKGVQLLYISPLKALNNDIARNLREPLAGIRHAAQTQGISLPALHIAVRTGDTPASARQRMVTQPPHILITTPESLYLILTSPQARQMLRTVNTVIVDEIHTLCGVKRGVHLALSLERLEHLIGRPFQRIGLSATQRPLDEVGRFLAGQEWEPEPQGGERLVSRAVTLIDAGARKEMALQVVTVVPDLRRLLGESIWPSLIPHVLNQVRRHRTTLIFTNGRRGAERAADRLNEQYALEESEEVPPGSPTALLQDGAPRGEGMFGTGRVGGPFRAHHGSVSRQVRLELEHKLKAGELPALVATSSLELGIDIGSVDAVLQLQSPRSIARGLQRVGRSGHLVGQTSVGLIYATHREDLLDAAAVAHGMMTGDIEPTYTPRNCLDVLAQQIVAMVACDPWSVEALHRLVRQAYGYQDLTRPALEAVLKMLSGGYPAEAFRELRPRLVWDRVHDMLAPLPGSRLLAIRNGGTIADRGEFRVYLPDRKTSIGTLDEEFVFETQPGDVFTLGSNTWRVIDMDEDKLVVADAAGSLPRMPFWHGEMPKRDYHTGLRLGALRRQLAERVADLPAFPSDPTGEWPAEAEPILRWLAEDYALDEHSARNAAHYVRQQLDVAGAISSDRTVVIETFSDALGDQRMVIHSCFGGRVNSVWALALTHAIRQERGMEVEVQVNDDGILFRFLEAEREPPVDLVRNLGPAEARERLLAELPSSALFGAQFRMNAARALLMPGIRGARRRTPFWLQRLRAKELLAATRGYEDFPILIETYRECLRDVLDLEHCEEVLRRIATGEIRIVQTETLTPSPVAAGLLFDFMAIHMYDTDAPQAERRLQTLTVNRELLAQLLDEDALADLLRPEAVERVEQELQHLAEGYRARSAEELVVLLHELGDLSTEEVRARCLGEAEAWLLRLAAEGRILPGEIPSSQEARRVWLTAEDYWRYRDALFLPAEPPLPLPDSLLPPRYTPEAAREVLLRLLLRTHGPLTLEQMLARYAFPLDWLQDALGEMVATGRVVTGRLSPGAAQQQWCDRQVLERIHRRTLNLLRQEIQPVSLPALADFRLRWQHIHPDTQLSGASGLARIMQQLRGYAAPAVTWERDLLPLRLTDYRPIELDAFCSQGDLVWVASGDDARRARVRFFFRGEGALLLAEIPDALEDVGEAARAVWAFLREEGACFASDLRGLGLSAAALDTALIELLLAGIVTNDHYGALRQALNYAASDEARPALSALDAELRAWRSQRPSMVGHKPSATRLREARRQAEQRLPAPTRWPGRWSLVGQRGVWGNPVSAEERALFQARQLLQRYGVVTRDCLDSEPQADDWTALYQQLNIMELRGEVRRGYFVQGLAGLQFALPEAVEQLHACARPETQDNAALILLNACDPALVYGSDSETWGEESFPAALPTAQNPARFARLPSNYVVLARGLPVLLYEHGSARWTTLPSASAETIHEAVRLCRDHLTREGGLCAHPRRVLVRTWNGVSPLESDALWLLERLGFRREPSALVWDGL